MQKIMERIKRFRDDREWGKYHTPRNLAVSVAIEAGELCEHFQWDHEDEVDRHVDDHLSQIGEEIADVMIYSLNLCQVLGLDPEKIINHKLGCNELRFLPPGQERPRGGA
jgi:NTP pyrophosphatase (non-canonical NTP hydrolase)